MNALIVATLAVLAVASAAPSGLPLVALNHNHWGSVGPSGVVTGAGASGPSGTVTGAGAVGPTGIVTGLGPVGPTGPAGHGIIAAAPLIAAAPVVAAPWAAAAPVLGLGHGGAWGQGLALGAHGW